MTVSRGICEFCSEPVDALMTAAFPVLGWEVERGGGGANQIIGRERAPGERIAHALCARQAAEKRRRGIAAGQESLL